LRGARAFAIIAPRSIDGPARVGPSNPSGRGRRDGG